MGAGLKPLPSSSMSWGTGESEVMNNKMNGTSLGFPGGAVVKNPPAIAGDTGSSPGLERSHMLRSN